MAPIAASASEACWVLKGPSPSSTDAATIITSSSVVLASSEGGVASARGELLPVAAVLPWAWSFQKEAAVAPTAPALAGKPAFQPASSTADLSRASSSLVTAPQKRLTSAKRPLPFLICSSCWGEEEEEEEEERLVVRRAAGLAFVAKRAAAAMAAPILRMLRVENCWSASPASREAIV
jgi:hypothetical protein